MSSDSTADVDRELERALRQYALGLLDEQPRLALEERLIEEPATFDLLGVIEAELTEEYLEGALSKDDRANFEGHFLNVGDHRRQLGFMRALRATASSTASQRWGPPSPSLLSRIRDLFRVNPLLKAAYVAAPVLLIGVVVWSLMAQRQMSTVLAPAQVRPPHAESSAGPAAAPSAPGGSTATGSPAASPPAPSLPAAIPTFALSAPLLRSGGAVTRIAVPPSAPVVRFRLDAPGEPYDSYRVVVYDGNADERLVLSGLHAAPQGERRIVTIDLPSGLLPPGDYQLKVNGVTAGGTLAAVASYTVRVTRG